jgi:hypothetical protein
MRNDKWKRNRPIVNQKVPSRCSEHPRRVQDYQRQKETRREAFAFLAERLARNRDDPMLEQRLCDRHRITERARVHHGVESAIGSDGRQFELAFHEIKQVCYRQISQIKQNQLGQAL